MVQRVDHSANVRPVVDFSWTGSVRGDDTSRQNVPPTRLSKYRRITTTTFDFPAAEAIAPSSDFLAFHLP